MNEHNKMIKSILITIIALSGLVLTACDFTDYQARIQKSYDYNNPSGNRALCVSPGKLTQSMYPYTINYLDGPVNEREPSNPIYWNNKLNDLLPQFAQEGLYSEEWVGEDHHGWPLYRYQLTEQGQQAVSYFQNRTYFCFGRVVVDSIKGTDDLINGVGGGTIRIVTLNYHLENIPQWIKNPAIYPRFRLSKGLVNGETELGEHNYGVTYDGKLKSRYGVSGGYIF